MQTKLASYNIRRDIIKNKCLTDAELDDIKTDTIQTNTSPTHREEQTQSTGTNEPEIPYERSVIAVVLQNTETINLKKESSRMKVDILRKWEAVKEQAMAERPSLKR